MDPEAPSLIPADVPLSDAGRMSPGAIAALRRFARPRPPRERCELCAAEIRPVHRHVFSAANRQISCACDACSILFSSNTARYSLVPTRGEYWPGFHLADADWQALNVPINLAFFAISAVTKEVVAFYPSPAGATEGAVPAEAWEKLKAENPPLAQLHPDVEALLINRVGPAREYFRAPIDECYRLVGLIRSNWRGLSGGADVWKLIAEFFNELREKSLRKEP